jgi:hypothetical protein
MAPERMTGDTSGSTPPVATLFRPIRIVKLARVWLDERRLLGFSGTPRRLAKRLNGTQAAKAAANAPRPSLLLVLIHAA